MGIAVRRFLRLESRRWYAYSDGMKPLTTSSYTFSDLIAGGYLYVDKTAYIHELVREYKGQYFLSRPRRFGKSLLISTLKSIFLGQRKLFDGLFIAGTDYDWKPYPVIHLDLGTAAAETAERLEEHLRRKVRYAAEEHGIAVDAPDAVSCFEELIVRLAVRDGSVVILVDEYDKPLLGHLGRPSAVEIQRVLKAFYSVSAVGADRLPDDSGHGGLRRHADL